MKKFLLMLVCLVLLVTLASPAMAADFELSATASKTTVYVGDEITISINVSGTAAYTSMGFFLEYDTSVFEYKSRSWGAGIVDANTKSFDSSTGKVTAVWEEAGAYTGEMIKITLIVKKAVPGNTTIKFTDASCKNINDSVSVNVSSVQIALACEHSYPKDQDGKFVYTQVGSDKHQQVCDKCGTPNVENHTWDDGTGKPAPTCDQGGTMEYTCTTCKVTRTETVGKLGHLYDNDCDTTCNRDCGYVREATHNYVLVTTDPQAHWYECACGALKPGSWEEHIPGAEPTETTAQVCTVCNYELKPASGHEHVLETEWTTDATHHWHRCEKKNPSCYYVADKAAHDYDNDCDVTCNTCAYVREAPHNYKPEWQANAQGHWQVCADCNAKSSMYEHVPGPEATMDTPQLCTECNFRIKMPLSHEHSFGEAWYSDDVNHWQSCSECQESTELIPHEWDQGVDQEDGKILFTCTVCEHQVLTDGTVPTEPTTPSTQAPTTQTPGGSSDSGRFPWEWAGIAAIILLVIGIVLLVIEFIRSRKTNMHGKFSK